jgi:hypothetical protein
MNCWHSLDLGDAITAHLDLERIRGRVQQGRAGHGCPADAGVFVGYDSGGGLHCEVTLYFAPRVADLARELGARPCDEPAEAGLEPLVR